MAAEDNQTICAMCGFKNQEGASRCVSCGARLDLVLADSGETDAASRRFQQETFELKWAVISLLAFLAVQALVLFGLPSVLQKFDPIGIYGAVVSAAIWFVGGIAIGAISPGKTFVEPAVGALFAVTPTIIVLNMITPEGLGASLLAYIIVGLLGSMCSLFGAFIGEKISGAPA